MDNIFMNKVIYETTDYDKFTPFEGQPKHRAEQNYRKLLTSIKEHGGNIVPILVDINFKVIDGNTRLRAVRASNMPIRYEIVKKEETANLELMKVVNSTATKWNIDNFIEFYAIGYGKDTFKEFKAFKQDKSAGITVYEAFVDGLSTENIEKGYLPDNINYSLVAERFYTFYTIKEAAKGRLQETGLARSIMAMERYGVVDYPRLYRAVSTYWTKALKKQETKKTGNIDSTNQALNFVYTYNTKQTKKVFITERTI